MVRLEAKWQALIVVSIGIFMSTLDGSIVNIANPAIASMLNVPVAEVQWVSTAYMALITSTLLFLGKLGDRLGNEKIYRWGFAVFTLGSLFCSQASTLTLLIVSRCFQALGASMMMATGMGIVSNLFPVGERGKALGITGSVVGIGNMAGPIIGGVLVDVFGWSSIFLVNLPIGLIGFIMARIYLQTVEADLDHTESRLDWAGLLLWPLIVVAVLQSLDPDRGINLWMAGGSAVLFAILARSSSKHPAPLLDVALLSIPAFRRGNLLGLLAYSNQMGVVFLLPFFLQNYGGMTAASTGILLAALPVTMAIVAPLAGSLADRFGARPLLAGSFIMTGMGAVILAMISASLDMYLVVASLVLMGLGMGIFGSPNASSVFASVPRHKAGYTGGFMASVRNLSYAFGIALASDILSIASNGDISHTTASASVAAFETAFYSMAAISAAGFLISLLNSNSNSAA